MRDALNLLLAGEGWSVLPAEDCKELGEAMNREPIQAVVSESSLPACSAEQILNLCKTRDVAVIFTGHDLPLQAAVDLIRSGALDYLDKPFPQGRLLALLEGLHIEHSEST